VADRYELGELLGSGGFASVFRATDTSAARDVALKIIPFSPRRSPDGRDEAGETLERFRREALALSRLRSRHVARVYDFGRDPEVGLFLVMEYIEGVPLDVASIGRALLPHEVLRVARGLLDALGDAHAAGIVHLDVKPSNILVPRRGNALDEVRVLDFGIARSVRRDEVENAIGRDGMQPGIVVGSPAYMAPEQLTQGEVGPAADVYAAGLVLFELLGRGPLFPGKTLRDQLSARMTADPDLVERIAAPLGPLLGRMLARDLGRRFTDACAALAAIGDLETAPVSIDGLLAASPPDASLRATGRRAGSNPDVRLDETSDGESAPKIARAAGVRATAFGGRRLVRLEDDPSTALREVVHALDLAMTDALARRERGSEVGRVARAVALALRLELDAASLVLEGLAQTSDLARAIGAAIVAPRARKGTRARVEHDRTDVWVDAVDPELAAMLASAATAMTNHEDAARNEARCRRASDRVAGVEVAASTFTTVRMARLAAACLAGLTPTSVGLAEMLALRDADRAAPSPFNALMRALLLSVAAFRGDEHLARQQLERASRLSADAGATLFEARALVAWGGTLVEIPARVEQGLGVLERAATLLANADAPSLEHIAEHNRGSSLIIQGRYAEAATHLHRARITAKEELSIEHETISCTNEVLAHLFGGAYDAATTAMAELSDKRLSAVSPRNAAFGHNARSLHALLYGTLDGASSELRRALACTERAEADAGDARLLAELLGILYASARGEPVDLLPRAGEIEKLAQDHGFASFYWMANLRAAAGQIEDDDRRMSVEETLERLAVMLEPVEGRSGDR
jgi:hypothetical protein